MSLSWYLLVKLVLKSPPRKVIAKDISSYESQSKRALIFVHIKCMFLLSSNVTLLKIRALLMVA